jgi:hypothetical protein
MSTQEDYRRDLEDVRDRLDSIHDAMAGRLRDLEITYSNMAEKLNEIVGAYNKLADGLGPAIDKIVQALARPQPSTFGAMPDAMNGQKPPQRKPTTKRTSSQRA